MTSRLFKNYIISNRWHQIFISTRKDKYELYVFLGFRFDKDAIILLRGDMGTNVGWFEKKMSEGEVKQGRALTGDEKRKVIKKVFTVKWN